jgi:hypothetical protein
VRMAELTARRRRVYPSKQEALSRYQRKEPYKSLHPEALRLQVERGFKQNAGKCEAGPVLPAAFW